MFLPIDKFPLKPHNFLYIAILLSLFAMLTTPCIASAEEELYVSSSVEGTKFTASSSTTYRFTIKSGAYTHTPSAVDGWVTSISIYKNRQIEWGESGDVSVPVNPDYSIGDDTFRSTQEEAEQIAKGDSVDIPLEENDYVIFVAGDGKGNYGDNTGGVYFSISEPYLIFSDDFERGDYSDKWVSGVDGEENENTIMIEDGYIKSTANSNYIETLESFKGNLRIEIDVMKVGNGDHSCSDFFITLVSSGVTGTIRFDYDGVDGINIGTNYDCGDKYTINSSGINKGKAVLTYSGSRAWFSFTNDDGEVLKTDEITVSPFIKSKIKIYLSAHQDSPRYIDNVKIYSLGSTAASTPTPTRTPTPSPTPKATPTPAMGTGIIYGSVIDEEGSSFRNVTVLLTGTNGYSKSTKTDEDGYYEFKNLAAGDYTLTYEKDDYQTKTQEVSLEEDETVDLDTIVMEQVEKGSISGYVVDITGDPVESAKLKLKGISTGTSKIEISDADGFFEFADLEADNYLITAKRKRYRSARKTVTIEEGEAAEIEIEMRKTTKRRSISLLMRGK